MLFTQNARTRAPIGNNGRSVFAIQCEHCKDFFREKDVQVNHKDNCIKNGINWDELEGIIRRMFDVTFEDLEHLCKSCHDLVTFTERYGGTIENAVLMKKVIKFGKLKAKEQKEKLVKAGIEPAKTEPLRLKQVEDYLNAKAKSRPSK
ncbi:MAG: hypothetical protein HRT61_00570 [Ekhidna sp.]|nr:hypothetical protein [Ekhidna sp.]